MGVTYLVFKTDNVCSRNLNDYQLILNRVRSVSIAAVEFNFPDYLCNLNGVFALVTYLYF